MREQWQVDKAIQTLGCCQRRQPLLGALIQTKLAVSERGAHTLVCSLWYILNVQPASDHTVFVPILGTHPLSVSIIAYSLCHDVAEDDAERPSHRKLFASIDTGNEKTGLVLFHKYILFSCHLS